MDSFVDEVHTVCTVEETEAVSYYGAIGGVIEAIDGTSHQTAQGRSVGIECNHLRSKGRYVIIVIDISIEETCHLILQILIKIDPRIPVIDDRSCILKEIIKTKGSIIALSPGDIAADEVRNGPNVIGTTAKFLVEGDAEKTSGWEGCSAGDGGTVYDLGGVSCAVGLIEDPVIFSASCCVVREIIHILQRNCWVVFTDNRTRGIYIDATLVLA